MDSARVARLLQVVDDGTCYDGSEIGELLADLERRGAKGLERLIAKFERATKSPAELRATVREAVYARFFARNGGVPEFEPKGDKGPDLGLVCSGDSAYLEIKRLLGSSSDDVESWYDDEVSMDFQAPVADRLTDKLLSIIKGAASQLITGEPNVVVLSDWSPGITRGNFRRAVDALEQEIATNGTYVRISAVVYDSNNDLGDMTLTWLNPSAEVPLPEPVRGMLDAAALDQSREFDATVWRLVAPDS